MSDVKARALRGYAGMCKCVLNARSRPFEARYAKVGCFLSPVRCTSLTIATALDRFGGLTRLDWMTSMIR